MIDLFLSMMHIHIKTKIKCTVLKKLLDYVVVELSVLSPVDETVHSMIFKIAIQMKVSSKVFLAKLKPSNILWK